jgi:threonine dehydratase
LCPLKPCSVSTLSELSRDDILRARETIAGRLLRTPVFGSRTLSELVRARVQLKAELFQRTGSFKPRGMLVKLASLTDEEKARGVVTWSAGNAAQALAWSAAVEGVSCRVFMWRSTNPLKVATTRGYGAEVDLEAENAAAAHERLLEHVEATGALFVHPFDDPVLQAGLGTLGLEIAEDVPEADVVVVPVGGGGLIAGVASALDCRVVGVEPEGAATLSAALAAGRPVPIEPRTIADGLAAPFTGEHSLAVARERVDEVVLVSDEEIEDGFRFLYGRAKLACEPAGAASTAALLAGKIRLDPGETVVAVVSGGNAAPETASAILAPR